ncbi:MAG: hypothetical protein IJ532_03510 [Alphaproteobacteria bacterium]|nr:hypothetical protein [Alphaproteobacteria bacterium]
MITDKFCKKVFALGILVSAVLPFSANAQQANVQANAPSGGTSLSDFIDQNQAATASDGTNNENTATKNGDSSGGNWLQNAAGKLVQQGSELFNKKNNNVSVVKRSNASVFDISGIMLRMDTKQVMEAMQKRGYRKTSEHLEIPNFIRWRYEEQCRNQGIVGYERTGNCVILLSRQNNYEYVQKMNFQNFKTQESIEVYFTSNFTGNKVHRVMYRTEAANVRGSGAKAEYLRNIKVFDFWKKINQKYGEPDNKENVTWGLGEKKPSLQASTGRLILDDPMLVELDYTRMSREDQKFMNTDVYTF